MRRWDWHDWMGLLPLAAVALAAALVVLVGLAGGAQAHSWYPRECCSNDDCAPIDGALVVGEAGGWRLLTTGELIPHGDANRLRQTPMDAGEPFHRCGTALRTRCLFVPEAGS